MRLVWGTEGCPVQATNREGLIRYVDAKFRAWMTYGYGTKDQGVDSFLKELISHLRHGYHNCQHPLFDLRESIQYYAEGNWQRWERIVRHKWRKFSPEQFAQPASTIISEDSKRNWFRLFLEQIDAMCRQYGLQ